MAEFDDEKHHSESISAHAGESPRHGPRLVTHSADRPAVDGGLAAVRLGSQPWFFIALWLCMAEEVVASACALRRPPLPSLCVRRRLPQSFLLVDVRTEEEFTACHLVDGTRSCDCARIHGLYGDPGWCGWRRGLLISSRPSFRVPADRGSGQLPDLVHQQGQDHPRSVPLRACLIVSRGVACSPSVTPLSLTSLGPLVRFLGDRRTRRGRCSSCTTTTTTSLRRRRSVWSRKGTRT